MPRTHRHQRNHSEISDIWCSDEVRSDEAPYADSTTDEAEELEHSRRLDSMREDTVSQGDGDPTPQVGRARTMRETEAYIDTLEKENTDLKYKLATYELTRGIDPQLTKEELQKAAKTIAILLAQSNNVEVTQKHEHNTTSTSRAQASSSIQKNFPEDCPDDVNDDASPLHQRAKFKPTESNNLSKLHEELRVSQNGPKDTASTLGKEKEDTENVEHSTQQSEPKDTASTLGKKKEDTKTTKEHSKQQSGKIVETQTGLWGDSDLLSGAPRTDVLGRPTSDNPAASASVPSTAATEGSKASKQDDSQNDEHAPSTSLGDPISRLDTVCATLEGLAKRDNSRNDKHAPSTSLDVAIYRLETACVAVEHTVGKRSFGVCLVCIVGGIVYILLCFYMCVYRQEGEEVLQINIGQA